MKTLIKKSSPESIETAAQIILSGGLVAFPTETVYGLGANALSKESCVKIFEAKKRPFFDPLICHVSSIEMVERISYADDNALSVFEKFSPGPVTVVMKKKEVIPPIVTSGMDTVAVRIPMHETALALIKSSDVPIAAPSANPFGFLSPTEAVHVSDSLDGRIDMIIDGGKCSVGVESTIISFNEGKLLVLRPGGIGIEELQDILKIKAEIYTGDLKSAPGMLESHYAPAKKLVLIEEGQDADFSSSALLSFRGQNAARAEHFEVLSRSGNVREAAANLFSALHKMDQLPVSMIFAEKIPEEGIGLAVMNRLRKASTERKYDFKDNSDLTKA